MSEGQPNVIYLKDYQVPNYLIEHTALDFQLEEESTTVKTVMKVSVNPACAQSAPPFELFGHESLTPEDLLINGEAVDPQNVSRDGEVLTLTDVPASFEFSCTTVIKPQENTALEGLYKSDGMFCTQCEAEGFRRITFYPDRPDVMSVFSTTIHASKEAYPELLSNGNLVACGDYEDGRHWVRWDDPHPKPAYLFALVAGDLAHTESNFVTASGRDVVIRVYAEEKDLDKLEYSVEALKNAMRWDEKVYGREYDLDIYMIVAVDFFNMGAMENKGLNIFNTSCVLAHPSTTTDAGFQRVEAVVAHEYFHNWSGNRVTCREWFQLSLKEGFTVFRDAEFSADMNSRTVKRIEDVGLLRTAQFAEDAGPMAHPIRPASFIEISNFYTMTVYEKGAEVVRMIHTLLGAEGFRKGSDLYFDRHDGQAVTTEDFVKAMEDATGYDLSQFSLWYSQAGTPTISANGAYDADSKTYRLHLVQSCPATPGQAVKEPMHIPVALGLIYQDGSEYSFAETSNTRVLDLTDTEQTFTFENVAGPVVPSLLRGFSAPVKLSYPYTKDELRFLMSHDSDGFARWEAGQQLCVQVIQALIKDYQQGKPLALDAQLEQAFEAVLQAGESDEAMVAKLLSLPSYAYIAELSDEIDVDAIHSVLKFLKKSLAERFYTEFTAIYSRLAQPETYSPDAGSIAKRSLKNLSLAYAMASESKDALAMAVAQYDNADNMTDQLCALSLVVHSSFEQDAQTLLDRFYDQWKDESLVVNQWLMVQTSNPRQGSLAAVETLMQHPAYDARNPNKLRALIGGFCAQNPVNFHEEGGSGYTFLADRIIELNSQNPQVASRMLTPLTRWRKYSVKRQALMLAALRRIKATEALSNDVFEVISKSLEGAPE